jgi:N-acetylneuraminic acid mutarotase
MPLARQEISSAALDGKICVIAGFNSGGGSTSDVQVYDPKTNSWSFAKPLPIVNHHNGAAVADGRLYSFGGVSNRAFVDQQALGLRLAADGRDSIQPCVGEYRRDG